MGPQTGVLGAIRRNLTSERAVQVHSFIWKTKWKRRSRTYPGQHDEAHPPAAGRCRDGDERRLHPLGTGQAQQEQLTMGFKEKHGRPTQTESRSPLIWTSRIIFNLVCT
ncbi:hypothetical protein BDP55DRAFT_690461 [Colletotrichum godetiae]|uniref:Uncharacterized protein n=1 Tax=Colletotrichum godetiae TaxID=1209918 RepID=A0AAJ0AY31_9PEZI|nr:uncharacterized protein BDP55DRAFT_690461 [Colletotrichum godetiae]KAK1691667.1 hypothetical protein BDP55DRAFT_690461 [Colletotrichum godetiae]